MQLQKTSVEKEKITGTCKMDTSAIIESFQPLMGYLAEQNKGLTCGWPGENKA